MSNKAKLILSLIIILTNNILLADSYSGQQNNIMLAPEHTPALALIDIYENRTLLANYIDTILESQTHDKDNWISTISIMFKHDRPGLLYDLLDKIEPELADKKSPRGGILWHEMVKENGNYCFRFSMKTKTKQDADMILDKIKTIPDEQNKDYEKIKYRETYKCLIEIEIPTSKKILKHISHFLKIHSLNNSSFLTPTDKDNKRTLVLEIEVPSSIILEQLALELKIFIANKADEYTISLRKGNLIDNMLDRTLMKSIKPHLMSHYGGTSSTNQTNTIRENLRKAFKIIASKHLSQSRKDQKTPYIMHQIDIINILVNEFNFLDSNILDFITEQMKYPSLLKTASLILESIILHDALEDGDISSEKLLNTFEPVVCDIVNLLTKDQDTTIHNQEISFISNILSRNDLPSSIAQIIKLGDRLQSLRSLDGMDAVFQRKIFFKTLNYFIPEFVDQLPTDKPLNDPLNKAMNNAIEIFRKQVIETGKKYNFLNQRGEVIEDQLIRFQKEEYIIDIIKNKKRLNFAEYMDEVLYGTYGFYTKDVSIGRDKDFDTFAENAFFADSIARQLIEMWENMGSPDNFPIIEMGGGSGALATNVLKAIQRHNPELFKKVNYKIIEISPKLINDQKKSIRRAFGSLKKAPISWIEGSVETEIKKLKNIEGVFLSNELVDQFPVHRVKFVNGVAKEVYVTFKNGQFQEELGELSSIELEEYIKNLEVKLPDGVELPVNLMMRHWQRDISKVLKRGYILTIDYGGKTEHIAKAHPAGVWNRHTDKEFNSTEEVMKYIYEQTSKCDITSEVDYYIIAKEGEKYGLKIIGYKEQREFLPNLGVDTIEIDGETISNREEREISNPHFKVLIQGTPDLSNSKLTGLRDVGTIAKYQFYKTGLNINHIIQRLKEANYIDKDNYVNKDNYTKGDNYIYQKFKGLDKKIFKDLTEQQIELIENIFKYALYPKFSSPYHFYSSYLRLPATTNDTDFVLITEVSPNHITEVSLDIPAAEFKKGAQHVTKYLNNHNSNLSPNNRRYFEIFTKKQCYFDKDEHYMLPITLNNLPKVKIWNDKGEVIFDFKDYFAEHPEEAKRLLIKQNDFDEEYAIDFDINTPESSNLPSCIVINKDGSCSIADIIGKPDIYNPGIIYTLDSLIPKRLCRSSS